MYRHKRQAVGLPGAVAAATIFLTTLSLGAQSLPPVYVVPFAQNTTTPDFPDLAKFLTASIRLRLSQNTQVRNVVIDQPPCENIASRRSSRDSAEEPKPVALSVDLPYYTVRGTVDVHTERPGTDPDVLVTYELSRSEACPGLQVKSRRTEKFALSDVLEGFGTVGDEIAADLSGQFRRTIQIDVFPVDLKGGGEIGSRTANLLASYLKFRLSSADGVVANLRSDSKLLGDLGVAGKLVFSADGTSVEGQVQFVSPDNTQLLPVTQRLQIPKENPGDALADFALNLAGAAASNLGQINATRQYQITDLSPAALLTKANASLCAAPSPGITACTPQPREALAALARIRKSDMSFEAWNLTGQANALIGDNNAALSAFDEAAKLPDAAVPVKQLSLLKQTAEAWYALQNYTRASDYYERFFRLAKLHQTDAPEFWAQMPAVCINWSRSVALKGDQLHALDILIESRTALGDLPAFRTAMRSVVEGLSATDLKTAIDKMTAALPPDDSTIGVGMTRLGDRYFDGNGVPQDYTQARYWYEHGAAAGSSKSKGELGYLYEKGLGVPRDIAVAHQWYEKAAAEGDAWSMAKLAFLYEKGTGVPQDYALARQWYEKAAAAGDAWSMGGLADFYEKGKGVPQDQVQARQWFEKAAAAGDAWSMAKLGLFYEKGTGGVPQDYAKARQWYEKAAATGEAWSMGALGYLYERGTGVPLNYVQARQWYEKAAAAGDAWSMSKLAFLYEKGTGVPQDYAAARQWYEKAAAAGDPWSMGSLGEFYEKGKGVPQDYPLARQWYEKAAVAGDTWSMSKLAFFYEKGTGVSQDYAVARQWYEKAAAAGEAWSMSKLAFFYEKGTGVPQDYVQARQWYEKAAAAGDAWSMGSLGNFYEKGKGVPQDYALARQWYEKAAAAGDAWSMGSLGDLYYDGNGVPKDYALARQWYEKAAAAGDAESMRDLGNLYEKGMGVPQDYVLARQWYEKAAAAGYRDAMTRLGNLYANGLGVKQDKKLARQWYEKAGAAGDKDTRKQAEYNRTSKN
jgi:TPR repeat protein